MTAQDLDDGLVGLRTLAEEKPKKDVAIRDFAFNKFPNDKTAMERLIADIYSAFWNGEFAPDGLTLRQDQSDPGPESFYRLTRSHLARAALGSRKYAEMGEARALEFLALFNFSDYRKMADLPHGYRYYFCPEDDAAGHKRGLCATEAELEGWYISYSETHSIESSQPLNQLVPGDPTDDARRSLKIQRVNRTSLPDDKVIAFFKARVINLADTDYPPTIDDDINAAQTEFPNIGREQVRRCRGKAYPKEWQKQGPRKTIGELESAA